MTVVTSTTFDLRTSPRGYASQAAVVALKELRDSLRNKWFLSFSVLFAVLTCALGYLSMAGTGLDGVGHPRAAGVESGDQRRAAVVRWRVVDDEHVEAGVGLLGEGPKGPGQLVGPATGADDDRDVGAGGRGSGVSVVNILTTNT